MVVSKNQHNQQNDIFRHLRKYNGLHKSWNQGMFEDMYLLYQVPENMPEQCHDFNSIQSSLSTHKLGT